MVVFHSYVSLPQCIYIYMVYIGKSSSKTDGLGGTPHFKKPPHIYIYIWLVVWNMLCYFPSIFQRGRYATNQIDR